MVEDHLRGMDRATAGDGGQAVKNADRGQFMSQDVVIGIDGGGTKTRAVVVTVEGEFLGEALGPSSNFQVLGPEKMARVLDECIQQALEVAGRKDLRLRRISAGLAGVGRPSDRERALQAMRELGFDAEYQVDSDAVAALTGAFAGGQGIIVIAGTGSICFGKGADGRVERSGGWGYLLGDEGSGYYIGQQAIIAALKDLDGRGPATQLRSALERRYGLERIDRIIPKVYQGEIDRTEIANLAPLVFQTAAQGDAVAQEVIQRAGEELGKLAAAVARRLTWSDKVVRVAPIGSLFRQIHVLAPHMERELRKAGVPFAMVSPMFDPAVGAALLGLEAEGITIDDSLCRKLAASVGSRTGGPRE
jgi:N-acetylglucosamine kinase-like BadF-type ATPase